MKIFLHNNIKSLIFSKDLSRKRSCQVYEDLIYNSTIIETFNVNLNQISPRISHDIASQIYENLRKQ